MSSKKLESSTFFLRFEKSASGKNKPWFLDPPRSAKWMVRGAILQALRVSTRWSMLVVPPFWYRKLDFQPLSLMWDPNGSPVWETGASRKRRLCIFTLGEWRRLRLAKDYTTGSFGVNPAIVNTGRGGDNNGLCFYSRWLLNRLAKQEVEAVETRWSTKKFKFTKWWI